MNIAPDPLEEQPVPEQLSGYRRRQCAECEAFDVAADGMHFTLYSHMCRRDGQWVRILWGPA